MDDRQDKEEGEKEPQIIEIDLSKKYVVIFDASIPRPEVDKIAELIKQWLDSNRPVCILHGNIKLVRVE